ncbi:BPSS1187 family protein [Solimonas marina]|uniref:Alpha/beta hydrolase family protein n=1 Tax=Solimonas marina TaxID=2714601 RepID=A0A970B4Q6_9GAMM|nr:hypothetical protein [Solimonas marina]NKF20795.1 hypothetical protein [Solimonas marina]
MATLYVGAAEAKMVAPYEQSEGYLKLQQHSTPAQQQRGVSVSADRVFHAVAPDEADPTVKHYLRDSYAMIDRRAVTDDAPLFVFLVGTTGSPDSSKTMLAVAAASGYRAISLMYDTMPATNQACHHDPDPSCSARFREKRAFGDDVTADIPDAPNEAVVPRLRAMLSMLAQRYPSEGWGGYLQVGELVWSRIAMSGHSQGAGLAAYIAQRHELARVVLFSSPWDYYRESGDHGKKRVAPWLSGTGVTPVDRWYAMYHVREPHADDIARAFHALGLDATHIRLATLAPARAGSEHTSVSNDYTTPRDDHGLPRYLSDWSFMLGRGADVASQASNTGAGR